MRNKIWAVCREPLSIPPGRQARDDQHPAKETKRCKSKEKRNGCHETIEVRRESSQWRVSYGKS